MNKHWTDKSKGKNNLADRIAGLSPAKRALIELRLKKKEPVVSGEQRIPQREKRSSVPLSFAQQRLWFLNQLGTSSAYTIPMAIRLKGLPNIKALENSLNEIIRRHEALRTTFRSAGGHPVQVISENISFKMPLIDLSGQPKAERAVEAERLTRDEAMRRFDLAKGPLFRAVLIRLSVEEHILLLTIHHIVSDGWSLGVFTSELAALYKAYCNGEASPLPELPIQYADFAHWQRKWLQGEVLENQLSYWRKQLEGVPMLQLFSDRPRPAVQTFAGANQNKAFSPTLTGALNDLSQRQGVTLFITLLAAFQTLLFRYTGQEDIVVGSPIANRNRTEIEGLIGFFVNSLAMRTDLSGNPSFLELLGRVGEVAFGAFAHQDLPFEKLVEELHPERDMSRTPLFQIMFALQNMPAGKLQLPGLTLCSFAMERITVRFDIEIHLMEKPEGLSGRVVYNTDLFDDVSIARLIGHYETLLESIVANPDQRISDLQILTDTERQQLLVEWNATETDYPRDRCVHQLFEQQVEQSPDAVAVVFKDQELTYRELNCRANQLAHHLQSLGVEPEVLVGICMQRSLEMIVGLLGVLKAGGAYVPLDSNYPAERLSFMLQDTGVPVLLTQKRLLNALPECRAKVICLDTDWAVIGKESEENLGSGATASNLAYVMYTSGSTGKPKGVCCNHAGVVNLLSDFAHRQPLHTGEGCSLWTSISFDVSVYEIFSALPAGGTLYIVPESVRSSAMTFVRWLSEHKIKSAYLPPFALSDLCDWLSGKQGKLCLSRLLVGVEPIQEQILAEIIRQVPGLQIINGYGPTEATICATLYSVKNLSVQNGNTPIGRPVQNTNIYLLNTDLKLVPIGNPGELYIGGVGLARGYLNRAELAAEKFIPNPFSDKKGARLYKSGDLVRYLQDGSIEFLGRIDHQVKIRGFRIELGEIESVLSRHPKVSDTVVIAREDVPGDKRLVAYVVASHEPTPTFSELRSFLKEKLPDYMIPTAFEHLDSLPITPNGKVDRRALPAPDVVRPDLQEAFVAPRSQSEELVAGIWSNVLGLERIGVHDSFFELGGHSLLVVQIVSRIREVFEVELPLRSLFETPTIAGLTELIETIRLTKQRPRSYRETTTSDRKVGEI